MLRPQKTRWRKRSRLRYVALRLTGSGWRELLAIALGVMIAAALCLGVYWGRWHNSPRHGFGSEWECADVPYADACVKRVQKPPR